MINSNVANTKAAVLNINLATWAGKTINVALKNILNAYPNNTTLSGRFKCTSGWFAFHMFNCGDTGMQGGYCANISDATAYSFYVSRGADAVVKKLDNVGTATTAHVLSGKTFSNATYTGLTGAMTNRGAWTNTPTSPTKVTIPEGYHNGSGFVDASKLSSTDDAIRWWKNVGRGQTDRLGTGCPVSVYIAVGEQKSVSWSTPSWSQKYQYNSATILHPVKLNNYQEDTSYTFDSTCQEVSATMINGGTYTKTIKGLKKGFSILSFPVKDSSAWYVVYTFIVVY